MRSRAAALHGLLRLLFFRGYNLARWAALAEESLALTKQIDDTGERLESLFYAEVVALDRYDLHWAEALVEEGLVLSQRREYEHGIFTAFAVLGYIHMLRGDRPGAVSRYRQSLQAVQGQFMAGFREMLGPLAVVDQHAALALCEQEVARCRAGGHPEDLAIILQGYAQLLLLAGDYARARATLEECLALWLTLGVRWNEGCGTARTLLDLGQVAWLQGDRATAQARYEESLEQYRHVGDIRQTARLHVLIGFIRLAQGDLGGAAGAFGQGLELFREVGQGDGLDLALAGAAALAEARGQGERAARLFAAAAAAQSAPEWHRLDPDYRAFLEREVAAACRRYDAYDAPAFASAGAEGQTMTIEQAVVYALQGAQAEAGEPPAQ